MLQRQLVLILVLALSLVPVLQTAHALTHLGEATGEEAAHGEAVAAMDWARADQPTSTTGVVSHTGSYANTGPDADTDRICLDCLALTGFCIIFSILAVVSLDQTTRQLLTCRKSRSLLLNFSTPYPTRGPPS